MADSYVCSGATIRCTMGTSQAKLTILPSRTVFLTGQPQANISDHLSMVNLAPFGRCRSLGFPATASATAAAHGKLTPMPCMHNTPFPWMGGKNDHIIKGNSALLKSSTCQCMWGGTISITDDGQNGEGTQWVAKQSKQQFPVNQQTSEQTDYSNNLMCRASTTLSAADLASTKEAMETFLRNNPQWFKNSYTSEEGLTIEGFQTLKIDTDPNNNGSTNIYGTIWLSEAVMNNCLIAFNKIENGGTIEPEEAKALSTLWHEINHNMHDVNYDWKINVIIENLFDKKSINTKYMETANEFVSRKTLPEFYKTLVPNGDVLYKDVYEEFMSNRDNTGYNPWVVKYQNAIKEFNLDEEIVRETVKKGLYETDYRKQRKNLINGLVKGGEIKDSSGNVIYTRITEKQAKKVVDGLFEN